VNKLKHSAGYIRSKLQRAKNWISCRLSLGAHKNNLISSSRTCWTYIINEPIITRNDVIFHAFVARLENLLITIRGSVKNIEIRVPNQDNEISIL